MYSLFELDPPAKPNGDALRDAAFYRLTAANPVVIRLLQRAVVRLALENGTVTADDVRDAVPIPEGVNPKIVGPVFSMLARAGILMEVDRKNSRRAVAHSRDLRVWRLVDVKAAHEWLKANPEYSPRRYKGDGK